MMVNLTTALINKPILSVATSASLVAGSGGNNRIVGVREHDEAGWRNRSR